MKYFISYGIQDYLRIQSKQYLLQNSGQAMLHVIRNLFQTLSNEIRETKPKQYSVLLVDSSETLFYVAILTIASYYL